MNQTSSTVILGSGFVGLFTALHLSQQNYSHPIILIDSRDRFTFKPLLYELLTGEMHFEQICPLITDLLAKTQVSFVQDQVESVDLRGRQISLASGKNYHYNKLVIALGSQPTYFNIAGAQENTFPFTSASEVLTLKARLEDCLQTAINIKNPEQRASMLTFAIIGAGPAGVELACTLGDLLPVWYEAMGGDYEEIRIVLVNRSNEILKGDINSRLRDTAKNFLTTRNVEVELLLDAAVTGITPTGIEYTQKEVPNFLPAMTIAWTGGTSPHTLIKQLAVSPENRHGRGQLLVSPTLQLPDFPEVFVGGDCGYIKENPQPATAQVAYQQGKAIASNLKGISEGRQPQAAVVNLRGTLMKLGIGEGVANIFERLELKGELGHLIRQGTYLELLPKPIYNLKATAEWFTDELLQRHQPKTYQKSRTPLVPGISAIFASMVISLPLIWNAAQPEQFKKQMVETGLPALIDHLTPESTQQ